MQISKACSLTRASERIKHDGSLLAKNVVKDPKSDEKCQKSPHHHIFYINVFSSIVFPTGLYFIEILILIKVYFVLERKVSETKPYFQKKELLHKF